MGSLGWGGIFLHLSVRLCFPGFVPCLQLQLPVEEEDHCDLTGNAGLHCDLTGSAELAVIQTARIASTRLHTFPLFCHLCVFWC